VASGLGEDSSSVYTGALPTPGRHRFESWLDTTA